jgi:hypothetical protein
MKLTRFKVYVWISVNIYLIFPPTHIANLTQEIQPISSILLRLSKPSIHCMQAMAEPGVAGEGHGFMAHPKKKEIT